MAYDLKVETERLTIRPYHQRDYSNWLHEHKRRQPAQHKYDQGSTDMSECTEIWFHQMVESQQELIAKDDCYIFGVFHKQTGVHIGTIDLSTLMRYDFQWGRIGYMIHNHQWRKGFGREAVQASLSLAFKKLDFHRIEAHINLDNEASIKLAESVGMQFECIRKGFIFEFGEWTDNLIYYITADTPLK
ncbi:GNAT family protein [Pseudalkalibacillus sp. SCS-8]|uniref:GNAT family N-acetyltransferase n=1 Tax=Pseudalkalibacillus nanhaiensis TaxID=3115291 RepID=UPI0032DA9252